MIQTNFEKLLCCLFVISVVGGLITSISSGIVWSYWRWTLDQCVDRNCSCILYGESTPSHFHGGSIWTCMWIIFGPIPVILIFGVLAIYHGVRGCFGPKTETTRSVMTKNESGEMIHLQIRTPEIEQIPRPYLITAAVFSTIFAVYMLGHFSTFADGYLQSCKQYKRRVIDMLHLTGIAVNIVHNRLSCNSVFDFMDYLQPTYNYIERNNFINTACALIFGMLASFVSTSALAVAAFLIFKFTRNT